MKTSLEWLSDFLAIVPTEQAAADALTNGGLPVERIESIENDTVIDVEVTSNRSDCLSHRGVARELAALLDLQFKFKPPSALESSTNRTSDAVRIRIDAPAACPHYTARIVRGVKIGPSPQWMIRRLQSIGVRPVNNIVDITNYVMFELGQPLHAFDFDRVSGGEIRVREAIAGESIVSIDGHERKLTAGMLVIADAQRPIALAGVMGARDSEVTDGTTNILLESARFDPLTIRKTARALTMKSDSSYRFERGIDPQLPHLASLRAAELIVQIAGGELLSGVVESGEAGAKEKCLTLRAEKLNRVLGVALDPAIVTDALRRVGFVPTLRNAVWSVTVPSNRLDVNVEIDLVEEVARMVGYQNIPIRDEIAIRVAPANPTLACIDQIRHVLAACGYSEAITVSFVTDALANLFTAKDHRLLRTSAAVRKADGQLRPSLLPGLLEAIRRNESVGVMGARLFEIGSAFWSDRDGREQERRRVTLVGGELRDVRGTIETVLQKLNPARKFTVIPEQRAGFGAAGRIEWGGEVMGVLGTIDPAIIAAMSLRESPAAAEVDLQVLLDGAQREVQLKPLPRFPAIARDLSLVVSDAISYAQIAGVIEACELPHLEHFDHVTTYRGKPLEKGTKSITIQMSFRSAGETLTADAVDAAVKRAIDAAAKQLRAQVRF
ncbi:MAG: phenylalanine--tRNA ligase subunit beta [Phycisphaerae bacterium]|nr:phenylalanine--tRNA ligase subunit beta [Phycisphaerae bacterium]